MSSGKVSVDAFSACRPYGKCSILKRTQVVYVQSVKKGDSMVDYDELDAMLLQEEEKQAEEELKKQGERLEAEKIRMEALSEEERESLDEHYEFDR